MVLQPPSAASWVTGYGVRRLASPHPFLGGTPLAIEARVVLASAVFFLVQFVVGDMEWFDFFRLLGAQRGVWECRFLSGLPSYLVARRSRCASCSGYGRLCDHTAYVPAVL